MAEQVATPQGSTVNDAANAIESLLTAEEKAATKREAPVTELTTEEPEVPEEEAAPAADSEEELTEEVPEEQTPVATLYTVKVNGEEKQLPIEELVKGYQFGADYTRKTMALAEERKAVQSDAEAARQERALYAQLLPAIQQILQESQQPPDFDKLYQENPIEAMRAEREWRKKQETLQLARQEQQRTFQTQQADMQKSAQAKLAEESEKLIEAIPEWKDAKKAAAEKPKLIETALKAGYASEEAQSVTDHRAVLILKWATEYLKMVSQRASIKATPPAIRTAPVQAATQSRSAPVTELTKAKQRLAKTGSVSDAAKAIEQML